MENIWNHLKKIDWVLAACAICLSLIGIASIYSSSFFRGNFFHFQKQIMFLITGFILMILVSFFDWRGLRDNPYFILTIYIVLTISLVLLLFFASTIKGIKGWFQVGFISIDPVEPLKILLIILLAKYFSARHIEIYRIKHIIVSGIYVFIPFVLVFLQPDFGSAMILLLLWVSVLVISGIELKKFLVLMFIFLVLFAFAWVYLLKPYQRQRVISFLVPQDELGSGWSQLQSKIAVGSGGLLGKGFRRGSQVQLGFLSLPKTDFIFAAIAEELGFIGVLGLLGLMLAILFRIMRVSFISRTNFPKIFGLGLATLLFLQVLVHIGMNLGVSPVVGIPLPFVSYGGGGMIANFMALGIIQSLKVFKEL